jgi:hypothetical protein
MSSRVVNDLVIDGTFAWQPEYGVETFAERHLGSVCRYVRNQKQHHAEGNLNARLEQSEPK